MKNRKRVDVSHVKKLDQRSVQCLVEDLKKYFRDFCVDFNTKGFLICYSPEIGFSTWPENRSEVLPLIDQYRAYQEKEAGEKSPDAVRSDLLGKRPVNDSRNVGGMRPPRRSRDVGVGMRPPEGNRNVGGGMRPPEGSRDVGGRRGTRGVSPSLLTLLNIPDEAARTKALQQYFYGNRNVSDMNPSEALEVRNRVASSQSLVEKLALVAKGLEFLEKEQANSSLPQKEEANSTASL